MGARETGPPDASDLPAPKKPVLAQMMSQGNRPELLADDALPEHFMRLPVAPMPPNALYSVPAGRPQPPHLQNYPGPHLSASTQPPPALHPPAALPDYTRPPIIPGLIGNPQALAPAAFPHTFTAAATPQGPVMPQYAAAEPPHLALPPPGWDPTPALFHPMGAGSLGPGGRGEIADVLVGPRRGSGGKKGELSCARALRALKTLPESEYERLVSPTHPPPAAWPLLRPVMLLLGLVKKPKRLADLHNPAARQYLAAWKVLRRLPRGHVEEALAAVSPAILLTDVIARSLLRERTCDRESLARVSGAAACLHDWAQALLLACPEKPRFSHPGSPLGQRPARPFAAQPATPRQFAPLALAPEARTPPANYVSRQGAYRPPPNPHGVETMPPEERAAAIVGHLRHGVAMPAIDPAVPAAAARSWSPPAAAALRAQPVAQWLESFGLEQYLNSFTRAEIYDLHTASLLNEQDIVDMGIPIGPKRKILKAVANLTQSS
eukprot:gene22652-34670_t